VLIVDGRGSIRVLCESLARVAGWPVDELQGRPVWMLLTGWTPHNGAKKKCALRLPAGRDSVPVHVAWHPLYVGDEVLFLLELESLLLPSHEAIMITSRRGEIRYVNRAFEAMTGFAGAELAGRTPAILKSGMHDGHVYRELWDTLLDGRVWRGTLINRRKDGELYREEKIIRPLPGPDGRPKLFLSSGRHARALAAPKHMPQAA
jgi:PAS domain S-box-containing protein